MGDLVSIERGLSYKGKYLETSGKPMINLGCFIGNGQFLPKKIKGYSGDYRQKHLVEPGDIVLANTDVTQQRVVLGSPAIVPPLPNISEYLFSHHVSALRIRNPQDEKWKPYLYLTLLKPEFRERAQGFATGTTVLALPTDTITDYRFIIPSEPILDAFLEVISPLRTSIFNNVWQSWILNDIRDELLPLLISGKLRTKASENIKGG